jgi:hypothetical protein
LQKNLGTKQGLNPYKFIFLIPLSNCLDISFLASTLLLWTQLKQLTNQGVKGKKMSMPLVPVATTKKEA